MGDVLTASLATPADSLRGQFAEHGVVVIPDFLDHELLALLHREIDAHYAPVVRERCGIDAVSQAGIEMDCEVIVWDPVGERVEPFLTLAGRPTTGYRDTRPDRRILGAWEPGDVVGGRWQGTGLAPGLPPG